MKSLLLPPSRSCLCKIEGRGAGGVRSLLALLLLASLACNALSPRGPAGKAPAYVGQFDCYGTENGMGAYSGRVTVQPGGQVTFTNYDGTVQTGSWTYDVPSTTFTFKGSISLASALYNATADTLNVAIAPNASVVHTAGGMSCQRAVPGQTGPP
jgi:hypothetical protein